MIDYDGAHVIDGEGENIGTVERTFAGDRGEVQFVEVKIGNLFAKHRMVPAGDADLHDDGLHVPYDKGVILGSPDVSEVRDTLDGDALDAVRAYYTNAPTADPEDEEDTAASDRETATTAS
jgi:hypothetical protein